MFMLKGYLHRIPVSVDRSHPIQNVVPNAHVDVPKPPINNVAQPGFTGIPQVDQIQQVSTASVAPRDFPDPSEFLVNLPPASNSANTMIPPNVSTPQAPLNEHSYQSVAPTTQVPSPPIQSFVPTTEIKAEPPVC